MKPIRKILALCVIVTSIIVFWLKPGINTAKDTSYTRRYEDTDRKVKNDTLSASTSRRKYQRPEKVKFPQDKKAYRTERINSNDKVSKLKAQMFSRAIQFEDTATVEEELEESLVVNMKDTVKINP